MHNINSNILSYTLILFLSLECRLTPPRVGEALQKMFHHGVRDTAPPDMVCPLTQPAHMCSSGLYRGTGYRLFMGCTVECARYKPLPPYYHQLICVHKHMNNIMFTLTRVLLSLLCLKKSLPSPSVILNSSSASWLL